MLSSQWPIAPGSWRDESELAYREVQQLDAASNAVLDLIDAGRLDKAEQAARKLLEDYPEVPDGHERLAWCTRHVVSRPQRLSCLQQVRHNQVNPIQVSR